MNKPCIISVYGITDEVTSKIASSSLLSISEDIKQIIHDHVEYHSEPAFYVRISTEAQTFDIDIGENIAKILAEKLNAQ